jgi:hypothetical protein
MQPANGLVIFGPRRPELVLGGCQPCRRPAGGGCGRRDKISRIHSRIDHFSPATSSV